MFFHTKDGKQHLNMRGDFVLSHNKDLVMTRNKSAAPRSVRNAKYVVGIPKLGFWGKVRVTGAAIAFIWSKSEAL